MEAFFVKKHGDAQPGVLEKPFLYRIREFRHRPWPTIHDRLAGPRYFPQSVFQQHRSAIRQEISLVVHKDRLRILVKAQILPGPLHLGDFFFQSHAPQQVINPLLNWKLWVAIRRRLLSETL